MIARYKKCAKRIRRRNRGTVLLKVQGPLIISGDKTLEGSSLIIFPLFITTLTSSYYGSLIILPLNYYIPNSYCWRTYHQKLLKMSTSINIPIIINWNCRFWYTYSDLIKLDDAHKILSFTKYLSKLVESLVFRSHFINSIIITRFNY